MTTFSPPIDEPKTLSHEHIKAYARDGYILLRGLFDEATLARLHGVYARAHERVLAAGESIHDGKVLYELEPVASATGGRTRLLRKVQEIFLADDEFRAVFSSDTVLDVVADLIGDTIYYHSSKLMCKPPLGGRRKPWHQDWAYWPDMDPRQVTVWTAIDPATVANGCMQVLPGSHLAGAMEHHNGEDFMIDESGVDRSKIIFAEMQPGDVLFFNVLLLHASDPNNSDDPRLAGIVDYEANPRPPGHGYGSDTPLRS
ncbi:MAG: phytanoyl-CoA dioxygenase family protein [Planctomycetota bacterium]|jgi:phytanoyl-CoA hydroxylase|nr:phytanoyl-CoA dioxygenase family protein [Planctomycetota bacterium]